MQPHFFHNPSNTICSGRPLLLPHYEQPQPQQRHQLQQRRPQPLPRAMQIATNGNGQCMMVLGGGSHMNNSDAATSTTSAVLYQHHHPQSGFNNNVSSNALSNKPLQLDHAAAGAVSTRRQKSMRRTNLPVGSPLDVKPIDDEERQLLLPFYSSTTCNDNNNNINISFNNEAVENDDNDAGADAVAVAATGVELLDEEMALLDDEILHGLCGSSSRRHRRRRLEDVDGDGIPSLDDDADDDREDEGDDVDVDVDDDDDDDDTDSTKSKVERFSENTIFDYFNLDGEVGPNRVEATCRLCARTVKATVGVTSNFLTHLRTHHKDMFKQYEQHRSEVTKKRGRPLKSLHQIKQRFSFAMRKRRREIIFSAFSEFETEDVPNDTSRICATCKLCNVTIRGTKTVSSNFYSHLKRKHPHDFKLLSNQAERELGKFPPTQPSISPTSFKNLLLQQQQNSTNSNGGGECSQRHQHQQQLIRHQHHQLHQSAAQFFQQQQQQQQQQNGGLMFSTPQQQEQKFFHQPLSVGVEHQHQPSSSLSINQHFIDSLTTNETLSPRLPPTQSDHDAADAVTVSESKFSPTPPPALGGVGDINRVRAKTFNTILVSADVGGNRTDLVITKVNNADDVGLLLAPTRSLLDFLSHFTKPRTEADGFVLYSFAGDCVAIVDELRKMGFTVINMSYLAPAGGATTTTTTIVAGESTVTVVEEEELQLIDQPHTDMRIINDDDDDNTTTTQEPSSFSAASVADAVSTASIIGSSSVLAAAATKQHQHQQPSTLNNECEKFVWLLTALPSSVSSS